MRSREARNVFNRLVELSVHGVNMQRGQILLVQAEIDLEEQARATAEAAYKRGAKFVDVAELHTRAGVTQRPDRVTVRETANEPARKIDGESSTSSESLADGPASRGLAL